MAPRDPDPGPRRGCYNLDNGRDPKVVVREVIALLLAQDLDWLCVVESAGYVDELRPALVKIGYRLFTGRGSFSRRDSAVIVRDGIPVAWKRVHHLGGVRWERRRDRRHQGLHPARHMVSVRVGKKGERRRVGAPHLPPPPHDSPAFPRRARAHRRSLVVLGRIVDRWSRAALVGWELLGDINKVATHPVIREWLRDHDAVAVGRGIDYAITDDGNHPDGIARSDRHDHGRGDHDPRTFGSRRR